VKTKKKQPTPKRKTAKPRREFVVGYRGDDDAEYVHGAEANRAHVIQRMTKRDAVNRIGSLHSFRSDLCIYRLVPVSVGRVVNGKFVERKPSPKAKPKAVAAVDPGRAIQQADGKGSMVMANVRSIDRVGQKIGDREIVGVSAVRNSQVYFICRCKCGRVDEVGYSNLMRGASDRCADCRDANMAARFAGMYKPRLWCACGKPKSLRGKMCWECSRAVRFGVPKKYPESISLVGKRFGVCRERVRQLIVANGWEGMLAKLSRRKEVRP